MSTASIAGHVIGSLKNSFVYDNWTMRCDNEMNKTSVYSKVAWWDGEAKAKLCGCVSAGSSLRLIVVFTKKDSDQAVLPILNVKIKNL